MKYHEHMAMLWWFKRRSRRNIVVMQVRVMLPKAHRRVRIHLRFSIVEKLEFPPVGFWFLDDDAVEKEQDVMAFLRYFDACSIANSFCVIFLSRRSTLKHTLFRSSDPNLS
jgi:hypothetical protein